MLTWTSMKLLAMLTNDETDEATKVKVPAPVKEQEIYGGGS